MEVFIYLQFLRVVDGSIFLRVECFEFWILELGDFCTGARFNLQRLNDTFRLSQGTLSASEMRFA